MSTPRPGSPTGALHPAPLRRVVAVLCLTQITSWGVLYYAFPVLAPAISDDTGWSGTATTAAFSAGQVAAGLAGVWVGHRIDRMGPRRVMTAGSMLAVPAVVVIATSGTYATFLVGWLAAGVAMSGVLYPPAFAALTHWAGDQRVWALTMITLVGGLASTVFAPLTAVLFDAVGWRDTYLVLVVVLAAVTIPAHWFGLRQPWTVAAARRGSSRHAAEVGPVLRSRPFLALTVAMCLTAFSVFAVVINLVPLFIERGFSARDGAIALGLGGVGQVCGRLGYARFAARTGVTARGAIVFAGVSVSTGLLAYLPGPLALLTIVSMLVGVARGTFTLIQATAVSDRWGTARFGALNGMLSAPILFAMAVSPFGGSALAELLGGQAPAFGVLSAIAAGGAVLFLATTPRTSEQ